MKSADDILTEGNRYSNQGNYIKAVECYDKSIQIDPNYNDAWKSKGRALRSLGRNEEAIECYDRAIAIDESDEYAWNDKGNILFNLGRKEEAIKCYDRAIAIDGNYKGAWYNKGFVLFNLGRKEEAIECYDRAIAIDGNYKSAWNKKGIALRSLGQYEEAIKCDDQAIVVDENFKEAWYNKGYALKNLGRYDEAIKCYDRAIAIDENYVDAWIGKGIDLSDLGQNEEAIECYDRAIEIDSQDILSMCNKAIALESLGRNDEAFDLIQHAHVLYRHGTYSSGNLMKDHFEYIERQFSRYRDLLVQVDENFAAADKVDFQPEQQEEYLLIRRIVQDDCIPLFNPKDRITEQDADAKEQRILDLLVRVRELEQNAVQRSEVSHAIRVNPQLEQERKSLQQIQDNPALCQYYDTLNQILNQAFVGAMAAESGLVQQSSRSNVFLSIASHAPIIGKAFEFLNFSYSIWKDIHQTNRIARFTELANGAAEMEEFVKEAAILITLEKRDAIQAAFDDRGKLQRYFDTLRGTILYTKCNTPAKRMAVEDATLLIQACMSGSVKRGDKVSSTLVYIALNEELISYTKPSCCLIL